MQTPTHIGLVAAALDRSVSELKELNPSLIKSVMPAGFTLRVPKGQMPQLEAALRVIPADRRDSWRVHRVEPGDTFAAVAKRYGTTADVLSSANHDQLPEAGMFAAVPVAYPGDRPATLAKGVAKGKVKAGGQENRGCGPQEGSREEDRQHPDHWETRLRRIVHFPLPSE